MVAGLRVINGGVVPGPVLADPWEFQARCVDAFVASWRARGFSPEDGVGPELVALATSAATSVVTAMATDAWQAVRTTVARLLGRGEARAEQLALEALDEDAANLCDEPTDDSRRDLTAAWAARLRDLLRSDPDAAKALHELVADVASSLRTMSTAGHAVAAGGDVHIQASQGGLAGLTRSSRPRRPSSIDGAVSPASRRYLDSRDRP